MECRYGLQLKGARVSRHLGDKYDILLTLTKGLSAPTKCLSFLYPNQIKTPGNVQHLRTYRLSYLYFSRLSVCLSVSVSVEHKKILQASPSSHAVRAVFPSHHDRSNDFSYTIICATPCPPRVLLAANSCFFSPASA